MNTFLLRRILLAMALCSSGICFGCPSGYESPESLVKKARLIVQVEVVDADEAPLPYGLTSARKTYIADKKIDGDRARVKMVEVLKGNCKPKQFSVIGGPCRTCMPDLLYVGFAKGDRLFLILEREFTSESENLVITWRNRVFRGTREEMLALMENARVDWKEYLDLHEKVVPEAMARARELQVALTADASLWSVLLPEGFEVLSCLRLLLADPDHLPPPDPPISAKRLRREWNAELEPQMPYGGRGFQYAGQQPEICPPKLKEALDASAQNDPADVGALNRALLTVIMLNHLMLKRDLADQVLAAPALARELRQPQNSPYTFSLPCYPSVTVDRNTASLGMLLNLADDEPDGMVWQGHSLPIVHSFEFNADVFAGYLAGHLERKYDRPHELQLLVLLPHPEIAPVVRKLLDQKAHASPDALFRFFATVQDPAALDRVLTDFEQTSFKDYEHHSQEMKQWGRERDLSNTKGFKETLKGTPFESGDLATRVDGLIQKATVRMNEWNQKHPQSSAQK